MASDDDVKITYTGKRELLLPPGELAAALRKRLGVEAILAEAEEVTVSARPIGKLGEAKPRGPFTSEFMVDFSKYFGAGARLFGYAPGVPDERVAPAEDPRPAIGSRWLWWHGDGTLTVTAHNPDGEHWSYVDEIGENAFGVKTEAELIEAGYKRLPDAISAHPPDDMERIARTERGPVLPSVQVNSAREFIKSFGAPGREPGCQCHQEAGDSPCRVHDCKGCGNSAHDCECKRPCPRCHEAPCSLSCSSGDGYRRIVEARKAEEAARAKREEEARERAAKEGPSPGHGRTGEQFRVTTRLRREAIGLRAAAREASAAAERPFSWIVR